MKPILDFVGKFGVFIIVCILGAIILFQRGCSGPDDGSSKPDTVVKVRTEYITQPPVYIDRYVPIVTETRVPIYLPPQYLPSPDDSILREQYRALAYKHLAENRYKDSTILRDSAGNRVGVFNNDDVVSENLIKSRQPSYQLSFPHTTKETTITLPYQPKRQLYVGGGLAGSPANLLSQAEVGLLYKDRKDRVYGAKGGVMFGQGTAIPFVGVSSYWKINLNKKK